MKSKILYPLITTVVISIGCFIHAIEYEPRLTVYYMIAVTVALLATLFGAIDDN